jgi:hypothetical protein
MCQIPALSPTRHITAQYLLKARHHGRAMGRAALVRALADSVAPMPPTVSLTWWPNKEASRTGHASPAPGALLPEGTIWTGTLAQQAAWMREYTDKAVHPKNQRRSFGHGTSRYLGSSDAECSSITELFCDDDAKDPRDAFAEACWTAGLGYIVQERARKWHAHIPFAHPIIPSGAEDWKKTWWRPRYGWVLGILSELGELACSTVSPKDGGASTSHLGFDANTDRLLNLCYVSHRIVRTDPVPETSLCEGGALDFERFLALTGYVQAHEGKPKMRQRNVWIGNFKIDASDNRLFRAFDAAGLIDRRMPDGIGYYVECPWWFEHSSGPRRGSTSTFINRTFYCHHKCRSTHGFMDLRTALPPHASEILFPPQNVVTERSGGAPLVTPAEMRADLIKRFVRPGPGLYMVHAETGIGKTQAFIDIAIARYNAAYAESEGVASASRHAPHSTTWILVPTHEVAQQLYASFGKRGFASVRYVMSPVAVIDPASGTHACAIVKQAKELANGGQYTYKTMCLGNGRGNCEHWDGCYARAHLTQGPEHAHVTIAVHSNLHAIGTASTSSLIVIDEAYDPIKTVSWDLAAFDHVLAGLGAFPQSYVDAMRPALDHLRACLERATNTVPVSDVPPTPIRDWLGTELVHGVLGARGGEEPGQPPRITPHHLHRARRDERASADIGRTSAALDAVERAVHMSRDSSHALADGSVAVPVLRIDADADTVELHLTYPDLSLLSALDTAPTLVYLDANADLHRPLYESLKGPLTDGERYLRYPCADGAHISRVKVHVKATRTAITPKGEGLVLANAMPHLHILRDRILETGTKVVGLITFKALSVAITSCMPEHTLSPEQIARIELMPATHRAQIAQCGLRELIESCRVDRWTHGHYGDIRGSDRFKHVTHLITLGDPRPPMRATAFESAYLCLPEAIHEGRINALASAHAEQAHGRLRTPHRTVPGHATHIGTITPSGTGWTTFYQLYPRNAESGASINTARATPNQVRAYRAANGMSLRALAAIVGCSHVYIARVESGVDVASTTLSGVVGYTPVV